MAGCFHLRAGAGAGAGRGRGGGGTGEEVEAEVTVAFGPFVVLFGQDGADKAGVREFCRWTSRREAGEREGAIGRRPQRGARGRGLCVPDWRPDALDNGRRHLLAYLDLTRERAARLGEDPAGMVLGQAGPWAAAPPPGSRWNPAAAGSWRP